MLTCLYLAWIRHATCVEKLVLHCSLLCIPFTHIYLRFDNHVDTLVVCWQSVDMLTGSSVQVTACDAVWRHWPGWGRVPELTGSEQQPGPAAPSLAAPGRAVSCRDIVSVIISCYVVLGDSVWCSLDKWQKCCCFDVTWFRLHSAGSSPVQRSVQWTALAFLNFDIVRC